jgi:hypothetical protein
VLPTLAAARGLRPEESRGVRRLLISLTSVLILFFSSFLAAAGLRTFIVLNKADLLDPGCAQDLSTIYNSEIVTDMCVKASAACGVPGNNVFPMKSYSNEFDCNFKVSSRGELTFEASAPWS